MRTRARARVCVCVWWGYKNALYVDYDNFLMSYFHWVEVCHFDLLFRHKTHSIPN